LRDGAALAQVLREKATPESAGDVAVLRRYERARKEALATMHLVTDGLQGLFAMDSAIAAGLRNSGMSFVDNVPSLKKRLMRHAMG
jgi:2-polyprenylphenol 6-hydroxylase